jgi:hypothetical protein
MKVSVLQLLSCTCEVKIRFADFALIYLYAAAAVGPAVNIILYK